MSNSFESIINSSISYLRNLKYQLIQLKSGDYQIVPNENEIYGNQIRENQIDYQPFELAFHNQKIASILIEKVINLHFDSSIKLKEPTNEKDFESKNSVEFLPSVEQLSLLEILVPFIC